MNLLFADLPILKETKDAIEHLGLVETTSIQHVAIPRMLEGKDIIGQAQTGTGKTFAFAIPILEKIDLNDDNIQALVICPTRELTLQVYKEFLKLIKFNKAIKITSIYGGESYTKQFKALLEKPQIVVATPGRAIDHLERQTMDFSGLKILVLDEADEMLKMGFQEDLEKLLKDTPKERQTALFSATVPPFIKKVATKYQRNPEMIKVDTPTMTVDKVEQLVYHVRKSDRDALLTRILDFYDPQSAIIFANTKNDVDSLSGYLQKHDYEADALHGDLKQSQRDYVMGRFRAKKLKYLIATDVAARGLDIAHVDMVINYEIPFEDEIYVHRIGRTARAGKTGISVSLVYPSMRGKLALIERFIKQKMIEMKFPSDEDIEKKRKNRSYETIKTMILSEENETHEFRQKLNDDGITDEQIINALLSKYTPKSKQYETIEEPQKRSNDRKPATDRPSSDRTGRPINYKMAKINLGKENGIRPVTLLDFLKKHADLYPKNIGDIHLSAHETEFQIHPAAIKRLEQLNHQQINGKKIRISFQGNR